jgi:hypothetical protein
MKQSTFPHVVINGLEMPVGEYTEPPEDETAITEWADPYFPYKDESRQSRPAPTLTASGPKPVANEEWQRWQDSHFPYNSDGSLKAQAAPSTTKLTAEQLREVHDDLCTTYWIVRGKQFAQKTRQLVVASRELLKRTGYGISKQGQILSYGIIDTAAEFADRSRHLVKRIRRRVLGPRRTFSPRGDRTPIYKNKGEKIEPR